MPELETLVLVKPFIGASLAAGYQQLGGIRTSAEITTERRTDERLRDYRFSTADFLMYDGKYLYFGGRDTNPFLGNINEACRQLIESDYYRINTAEKEAIKEAVKSDLALRLEMDKLCLKERAGNGSCFHVDTEGYGQLNSSQRDLAEAVYGQGEDFIKNMKMFRKVGIKTAPIYVLNQKYVQNETKNGPIAWPGYLENFHFYSQFGGSTGVFIYNICLRGERRESVAVGDKTKN